MRENIELRATTTIKTILSREKNQLPILWQIWDKLLVGKYEIFITKKQIWKVDQRFYEEIHANEIWLARLSSINFKGNLLFPLTPVKIEKMSKWGLQNLRGSNCPSNHLNRNTDKSQSPINQLGAFQVKTSVTNFEVYRDLHTV